MLRVFVKNDSTSQQVNFTGNYSYSFKFTKCNLDESCRKLLGTFFTGIITFMPLGKTKLILFTEKLFDFSFFT